MPSTDYFTAIKGLYLGYNAGASGTYTLSGSGLLSAWTQYVGYSGTGNFTQTGGTNASSTASISAILPPAAAPTA